MIRRYKMIKVSLKNVVIKANIFILLLLIKATIERTCQPTDNAADSICFYNGYISIEKFTNNKIMNYFGISRKKSIANYANNMSVYW